MSKIVESLYCKYGINENINSLHESWSEEDLDDFYNEFDPDGDEENGFAAHDEDELYSWVSWCSDRGLPYEEEIVDDDDDERAEEGYYGWLYLDESLKESINNKDDFYKRLVIVMGDCKSLNKNVKFLKSVKAEQLQTLKKELITLLKHIDELNK